MPKPPPPKGITSPSSATHKGPEKYELPKLIKFQKLDGTRVQWQVVDGEAFLVDADGACYYGLNRVGTFVWTLLAAGALSRGEIVARVADRHGQEPAVVAGDVGALLDDLVRERLIEAR